MTVSRYTLPALGLMLGGLAGAAYLVMHYPPYLWARWLFFAALFSAAFGASFPFFYFWQHLQNHPYSARIASRQAALAGLYLTTYLWLEQGLALSRSLALLLTLPFLALNALLARSTPRPSEEPPDDSA